MASKKRKNHVLVKKNKAFFLAAVIVAAAAAGLLLQNSPTVKRLTNKIQGDTVSNGNTNAGQDTIDCSKKLTQKNQSEIEKMISQGKTNPNDCLHMGCGNFF